MRSMIHMRSIYKQLLTVLLTSFLNSEAKEAFHLPQPLVPRV